MNIRRNNGTSKRRTTVNVHRNIVKKVTEAKKSAKDRQNIKKHEGTDSQ